MYRSGRKSQQQSLATIATYQAGITQSSAQRLLRRFIEDCVSEYGITTTQWFMIGLIYDSGPSGMGVSEISKRLGTNIPYVTNTLNVLETKGVVSRRRRSEDNRAKVVTIAPSFVPVIPTIEDDLRRKMRDELYPTITPGELHAYVTVLYKLATSLKRYD
ncbi:MAG TPA: MarR family transcriptional regulator [Candidatus Saccharimonadales bacterium]